MQTAIESPHASASDPSAMPPVLKRRIAEWKRCQEAWGEGPLVSSVLVTPAAEYFPESWRPDRASVRRVLARLLSYLSCSEYEISIFVVDENPDVSHEPAQTSPNSGSQSGGPPGSPPGSQSGSGGPASQGEISARAASIAARGGSQAIPPQMESGLELSAWLSAYDREKRTLKCSVLYQGMASRDLMLLSLARVAAHVAAIEAGLLQAREHTRAMIDTAAVYLGLGILVAHASHLHHRSSSRSRYLQLGALDPNQATWSLALFCRARRLSPKAGRVVAKNLPPNQGQAFSQHLAALQSPPAEVETWLSALPAPGQWPAPRDAVAMVAQGKSAVAQSDAWQSDDDPDDKEIKDRGIVGKNKGQTVFMVRRSIAPRVLKFGVGLLFLGQMLMRGEGSMTVDTTLYFGIGIPLVLAAAGVAMFIKERRCSDPKCDARLSDDMSECPRCGGSIGGVIKHPKQRLEALEELRNSKAEAPSSS